MIDYVKLGDELDRMIAGYDDNLLITAAQRQTWFKEGKRKAITHGMMGHDHPKALRLDYPDGRTGETVGSLRSNSARRFWDYGEGHVFPPTEDLLRFGLFMHLDFYRVLALILKANWEYHFSYTMRSWRPNRGVQILDVILDAEDHEIREALLRFKPDSGEMFRLLDQFGFMIHAQGYTEQSFDALMQEMILSDLHRVGIHSREMEGFIDRKREEQRLLKEGTPDEQQAFLSAKFKWIERQEELGDLYLRIEETRIRNVELTRRWLAVFGEEEVELRQQILRYERLDARYTCKLAHPDLERAQIEECLREKEEAGERELRHLSFDVAMAPHLDMGNERDTSRHIEDVLDYRKRCKKTLRRIYMLIHPDHLANVEAYQRLTPERQEELKQILVRTFQIRPEKGKDPEVSILLDRDLLERLQGILDRVETLLEYPDIETDVDMIIRGDSLSAQRLWLEHEMDRLDKETDLATARLQALLEGDDILQKRDILGTPEKHPRIKEEMKTKAAQYREKADALEREIERLFAGEGSLRYGDPV